MKRCSKLMMGLILATLMVLTACTSSTNSPKHKILVINSYAENSSLYLEFEKTQNRVLEKEGIQSNIRYIYLDCERYREQEEIEQMRILVDSVARNWKPDIIFVNDDQATYSLLMSEAQLARIVPVVFSGVSFPNKTLLQRYRNITGVHDKLAIWENIKLMQELFKEDKELFTLLDSTYLDMQVRDVVFEQLMDKPVTGFFDVYDSAKQAQLITQGAMRFECYAMRGDDGESERALEIMRGGEGAKIYLQLKRDVTTEKVGFVNVAPCLTAISEGFDRNEMLLGGYFSTAEVQMEQQAKIAARVLLKGEKVESIPIQISIKKYFIDWNVWRLLGRADVPLPSYATVVNKPVERENSIRFYGSWGVVIGTFGLFFLFLFLKLKSEKQKKEELVQELQVERDIMALAIRGGGTYAWQVVDDKFVTDPQFWNEMKVKTPATRLSDFVYYIEEDARQEALLAFGNLTETTNKILQAKCDFGLKGIYKWWEFRFVTQKMGGKVRTMGLLLDIDQKKRYEEDMKRAREIAEKTELKHSFLTNISHEIRTPLNAIVGFTAVLHSGDELDEEEKRMCLESINENTEQLLSLVGDILDLSKFESGTMDMQLEKYNAKDLIEEIYEGFKRQISNRLEFRIENLDVDAFVTIDRVRFIQVMNSFLNNASKFTPHGYVKLGCVLDNSMHKVHFYVEDSGVGIKEEELKIIFSRFYKQDEFSKGTGLGLALSKVIVEKLDGKLQVVSKVGVGSRFIVTLPCWRILSNKEILG